MIDKVLRVIAGHFSKQGGFLTKKKMLVKVFKELSFLIYDQIYIQYIYII